MNEESHNSSIESELEARIIALVLGEASDFESEELNRLITLRPELATFKLRMQSMHGLLQDVGTGEFEAPDEDWKLPADRRNAILAVICGEATVQPAGDLRRAGDVNPLINHAGTAIDDVQTAEIRGLTSPARQSLISDLDLKPILAENKSTRRLQRSLTKLAAVVCVAGFIGIVTFWSFASQERAASEYFYEVAKTDAPHDDVTWSLRSQERHDRGAVTDTDSSDRASVLFSPVNGKSATVLSAIQDTLNTEATLPNEGYLADNIEYFSAGPEFKPSGEAAAQDEFLRSEKAARAAPTIVDGRESTRSTVDDSALIARNSGTWMYRGLGVGDQNGNDLADHQPASPDSVYSDLSFPMNAEGFGELRNPVLTKPAPSVSGPDVGAVQLGEFERPSLFSSTLDASKAGALPPAIVTTNESEELTTSPMTQSTGGANRTLDLSSVAQPGDWSKESRLGEPVDRAQTLSPEQPLAQQSLRELAEVEPEFSKRRMADPDAGTSADGENFGSELKFNDDYIVGTTAPSSGAVDKSPGNLFDRGGRGRGRYANDAATGYSGGGDGALNLPSDELGKEMPAAAEGFAEGKTDGVASFDDSGLENSSRSKVPAQSSMKKMKAASEWSAKQSLEALNKEFVLADPAEDLVTMSAKGAGEKAAGEKGASAVAGKETDWFERDSKGLAMPNAGGVVFEDSLESIVGFNVPGPFGKSADTPAFGSGEKEFLDAKTGDGSQVQDNRESQSQSIRTPAPVTRAIVVPETVQPEQRRYMLERRDSVVEKYWDALPSEQKEQLVESQRKSGDLSNLWNKSRYNMAPLAMTEFADSMKKQQAKTVAPPAGLNETTAAEEAFSTFSLHVSDVSFKLAQAALARGEWPEAAKIRIEEFVNAFDYGDPMPGTGEKVACRVEQSIHPFVQQRNLLRVSMRTATAGRASNTPLRLTFLLDNSGSMERIDRQQTVRRAFAMLAQQLTPIDQVTLISFARQPRLLADKVSGADAGQLVRFIDELPSEGGTNIEAALQLAFEKAREHQTPDAQNRIILLTDGAVNLGDANPESLSQMVSTMRGAGIAFDAAGISAEGLNDEVLEALTRKGDGRYYLLDSLESADDGFARQIAGALRPSAKNVKVQVEFNPKRVGSYKLLGFEKHILKTEDFRNDKVDAAEMAAAEAGVAMYQFEAKPDGEGDVGSVSVRFQDLSTGQMIENRWPIPYEADAPRADQAAPSLRIATSAALLAAKLRGEPLGETVDLRALSHLISGLPEQELNDTRVQQLQQMIEQARQMSEK